jgi:aspartate racemase
MLTSERDRELLINHVEQCFESFQSADVSIIAIACNTLHSFLPDLPKSLQLVHLIEETGNYLEKNNIDSPLMLCSNTSAEEKVHSKFFSCRYPERAKQIEVDEIINQVLRGEDFGKISERLDALCGDEMVVLGCTELSLLNEKAPLKHKKICDPNQIVAEKICSLICF